MCPSLASLLRRLLSKNKTKVLKISIIEGKYLGFRYLPLFFVFILHVLQADQDAKNGWNVSTNLSAYIVSCQAIFWKALTCHFLSIFQRLHVHTFGTLLSGWFQADLFQPDESLKQSLSLVRWQTDRMWQFYQWNYICIIVHCLYFLWFFSKRGATSIFKPIRMQR